jgi:hypothetical protein
MIMSFRTVYLLEHVHIHEDGEQDVKTIGIYSSRENAQRTVERLRIQPGFRAAPEGFSIAYSLDEDNWTESFITISHDASSEGD